MKGIHVFQMFFSISKLFKKGIEKNRVTVNILECLRKLRIEEMGLYFPLRSLLYILEFQLKCII
jgi:hypothetical protein